MKSRIIKKRTGANMTDPMASCVTFMLALRNSRESRTGLLTQLKEMIRTASGAPDSHQPRTSRITSAISTTKG